MLSTKNYNNIDHHFHFSLCYFFQHKNSSKDVTVFILEVNFWLYGNKMRVQNDASCVAYSAASVFYYTLLPVHFTLIKKFRMQRKSKKTKTKKAQIIEKIYFLVFQFIWGLIHILGGLKSSMISMRPKAVCQYK